MGQAGLGPEEIDAAILYDAFTPMVLLQFEEYGFCDLGNAKDFIADGNLELTVGCRSTPTAASSARRTSMESTGSPKAYD